MRLYRTPSGRWAGTQADAKDIAREEGCAWEEIDVPTDKAGLLHFFDAHRVAAIKPTRIEAAAPAQPATVAHDISVEEEIAKADLPNTIRLADHIMWRLNEHTRAAERLKALVG